MHCRSFFLRLQPYPASWVQSAAAYNSFSFTNHIVVNTQPCPTSTTLGSLLKEYPARHHKFSRFSGTPYFWETDGSTAVATIKRRGGLVAAIPCSPAIRIRSAVEANHRGRRHCFKQTSICLCTILALRTLTSAYFESSCELCLQNTVVLAWPKLHLYFFCRSCSPCVLSPTGKAELIVSVHFSSPSANL